MMNVAVASPRTSARSAGRRWNACGMAAVLAAGVVTCAPAAHGATGGGPETAAARQRPIGGPPTEARAWVARVLLPTVARSAPRAGARVAARVSPYGPYDDDPQALLVLQTARSSTGPWYRVLLPVRPNGTSGWVHGSAVQVTPTAYRVRVRLSARRLEVLVRGRRVRTWPVAVGTTLNPTPTGLFAVSEIVPQSPANGFFGPYIMPLTAHSPRLSDFDGGQGQVAIHGTSLPSLLGQAVSHGCVRMDNAAITWIARRVPRGAPVQIIT